MTKLETALLITPFDIVSALVAYGAEQAFIWTGCQPKDDSDFYFELGRKISQQTHKAWAEELEGKPEERWD